MVIRQQVGRGSFQAEKQNEPLDPDICLFSNSKLYFWEDEYKDEKHLLESVGPDSIYGACDPSLGKSAHSGDYSAIVIVYREHKTKTKYVLVADLARRSPDRTVERIIEYARMYRISGFSVEGNHFQELMIDNLKRRVREASVRLSIRTVKNRSNKQARIAALEPEICQGWIRFSRQHQLLLDQLRGFPVAKHDDGPDALEMVVTTRHNKLTVRQF